MPIGKKTKNAPEIGDLVTVKSGGATIYQNSSAQKTVEQAPANANLGEILLIEPNEYGVDMYVIEKGAVFSDEVTAKVNPLFNYGGETTVEKTTQDSGSGGFWNVFSKVLDLGVGIFTKKKTGTTDTDTTDTTQTDAATEPSAEKKGVPTWVWITGGVVIFGGLMAALFWPKKPKQTPTQPIVIKS